jgi:hypothetical protein
MNVSVLESIFNHFLHVLFVRSKSISLAHTQGEGITQGYQEGRDQWSHLKPCLWYYPRAMLLGTMAFRCCGLLPFF